MEYNKIIQNISTSLDKKIQVSIRLPALRTEIDYLVNNPNKTSEKVSGVLLETNFTNLFNPFAAVQHATSNVIRPLFPAVLNVSANIRSSLFEYKDILAKLNNERKSHIQTLTQLEKARNEIADRLNQVPSPFGKLPIKLEEAIAIFPPILAIGFVVYASLLCDTIRLRKELHNCYRKKDQTGKIMSDQKMTLITPLWIDPLSPKLNQVMKFIISTTPLLTFVLSWYMITTHLILDVNTFPGGMEVNRQMYTYMYIVSLMIFAYSYYRIIATLHEYKI